MLDPVTASRDRVQETGRWGYTGDPMEDHLVDEDSPGAARWLPWVVLLLIAAVVVAFLIGFPA